MRGSSVMDDAGGNRSQHRQLTFDFSVRSAMDRNDFIVAPCNHDAVVGIDAWHTWPQQMFAVYGPQGAGKTHLAHVWREMSDAVIIAGTDLSEHDIPELISHRAIIVEDGDALADENALFHLFNAVQQERIPLMLTGRDAPARWAVQLKDLQSRLTTILAVPLQLPDDAQLAAVMAKQFRDRGLSVGEDVIDYLLWRMDRSFESARRLVEALDQESLAQKRRISKRLAGEVLDHLSA